MRMDKIYIIAPGSPKSFLKYAAGIMMVFWSAAIAVTVGLYMSAVSNVETEMIASHGASIQLVQSE